MEAGFYNQCSKPCIGILLCRGFVLVAGVVLLIAAWLSMISFVVECKV
jgi:hypothetical protein